MKQFGFIKTKLFHFHRIFKNGGRGGSASKPHLNPTLQNVEKCLNCLITISTTSHGHDEKYFSFDVAQIMLYAM